MKFLILASLIFSSQAFAKTKTQTVTQFLETALQNCDQKIRAHVLVHAKRERKTFCVMKDNKCQSCSVETSRIVDANNFPLVQSTLRTEFKKLSCEKFNPAVQNPLLELEPELHVYRAQFAVMPLLLFGIGSESTVSVYHLEKTKKKEIPNQPLMIETACPRLFKKKFKISGKLDWSGVEPKLTSRELAKLKYQIPMVPLETVNRLGTSQILLDSSRLDSTQLQDGDLLEIEGQFVVLPSKKYAPEFPAIKEKNTLIYFRPTLVTKGK